MTLPDACPRTGDPCTGEGCSMYILEWRSKNEYCMIGYYAPADRKVLGEPVVDTYARRLRRDAPAKDTADQEEQIQPGDESEKIRKARNFMNLDDIPDDYEARFWNKL